MNNPKFCILYFDYINRNLNSKLISIFDTKKFGYFNFKIGSKEFYECQFKEIKNIGFDAICWHMPFYYDTILKKITYNVSYFPDINIIDSLNSSSLQICPYFDFTNLLYHNNLDNNHNGELIEIIIEVIKIFYSKVPRNLIFKNNLDYFIHYFDSLTFKKILNDDNVFNESTWFELLNKSIQKSCGDIFIFLRADIDLQMKDFFIKNLDRYAPYHLLLTEHQPQIGHNSVTWNFGIDTFYDSIENNTNRKICSKQYYMEMTWLAYHSSPISVLTYSWDDPYWGSMLFPSKDWGLSKLNLAKSFISKVKNATECKPIPTLIIIDRDLPSDDSYSNYCNNLRLYLIKYVLRRFCPHSDITLIDNVCDTNHAFYTHIIDLTFRKDTIYIENLLFDKKILVLDPLIFKNESYIKIFFENSHYVNYFHKPNSDTNISCNFGIINKGKITKDTKVLKNNNEFNSLLINKNIIYFNGFFYESETFSIAFENFYENECTKSVLFSNKDSLTLVDYNLSSIHYVYNDEFSMNGRWDFDGINENNSLNLNINFLSKSLYSSIQRRVDYYSGKSFKKIFTKNLFHDGILISVNKNCTDSISLVSNNLNSSLINFPDLHESAFHFYAKPLVKIMNDLNIDCDLPLIVGDNSVDSNVKALGKSRPIGTNNIYLLNLNEKKFFGSEFSQVALSDTNFNTKLDKCVWRGSITGLKNKSSRFFLLNSIHKFDNSKFLDVGFVKSSYVDLNSYSSYIDINNFSFKDFLEIYQLLKYKYILALEGNDISSSLAWILSSNSVPLMPYPKVESWLMQGLLIEWVHFIPVSDDLSDLEDKVSWCNNNPSICLDIANAGKKFMSQFDDLHIEELLNSNIVLEFIKDFHLK